jgi:hypothetical protein
MILLNPLKQHRRSAQFYYATKLRLYHIGEDGCSHFIDSFWSV